MLRFESLRWVSLFLCGGLGLLAGGCATSNEGAPAATTGGAATAAPATSFQAQVTEGQKLYEEHCGTCHGDAGEGGAKAPPVVGLARGALPLDPPADRKYRKNRFVTVADVADFVVPNMPPGKGNSLPADQYWAILAFDLHANGVDLQQPLTADLAKTLTIPR
jgi:mono/diheme cytochrome c family protein